MAEVCKKLRKKCHAREAATGENVRKALSDVYEALADVRAESLAIEAEAFGAEDEHARFWLTRARQIAGTLAHAQKFLAKARIVADEMDAMAERMKRDDEVRAIGAKAGIEESVVEAWVARHWTPERAAKFVADRSG